MGLSSRRFHRKHHGTGFVSSLAIQGSTANIFLADTEAILVLDPQGKKLRIIPNREIHIQRTEIRFTLDENLVSLETNLPEEGEVLTTLGKGHPQGIVLGGGSEMDSFMGVWDVVLDEDGNLLICDRGNKRVVWG